MQFNLKYSSFSVSTFEVVFQMGRWSQAFTVSTVLTHVKQGLSPRLSIAWVKSRLWSWKTSLYRVHRQYPIFSASIVTMSRPTTETVKHDPVTSDEGKIPRHRKY